MEPSAGAHAATLGGVGRLGAPLRQLTGCAALGGPRIHLDCRLVFLAISERAHGLSVGVNICPTRFCSYNCVYCEVDWTGPLEEGRVDPEMAAAELDRMLTWVHSGRLREVHGFDHLPADLLQLREVILTGNGEPTFAPNFSEIIQALVHVRAQGRFPFFRFALATNTTGLKLTEVRRGLAWLNSRDEIWVKLDAGTQAYMNRVNRSYVPLERVLDNIRFIGRRWPVVIQSLFPRLDGEGPSASEVDEYVQHLVNFKQAGVNIVRVQICSARKPSQPGEHLHLPLRTLSEIARKVHEATGLNAETL
jgi:wyosine [tRNA(Phe)-imidazoG37] synthetase (radical SAM superfamily)